MDPLAAVALLVVGMAGQDCLDGLTKSAIRLHHGAPVKLLPVTILVFNVVSLAYMAVFAASYFGADGENCVAGSYVVNAFSHLFFLIFDFFLLYKCWVVISYHRQFITVFAFLLVNRLIWAGLDIYKSGGRVVDGSCTYSQNRLTGYGYNFSDLLVDILVTATVFAYHVKHLFTAGSTSKVIRVIFEENILRTLVIVGMQTIVIWMNGTSSDPLVLQLTNAVQNYVFVRAINVEFYWFKQRNITVKQPTTSGSVGACLEADSGGKNSWNDDWIPDVHV
ncbi:hypothetical protein HK101_011481 [Irineochytrium annulatum]|nr:hypothetical protein HK101_011481 [Irineochytrium annulatum]